MATTYEERLASMKANREAQQGVKGLYHANINVLDRSTLEDARKSWSRGPACVEVVSEVIACNRQLSSGALVEGTSQNVQLLLAG